MTTPAPATNAPTLDPNDVREIVRRALNQPIVTSPGSSAPMAPEDVRRRISQAFVARGLGNTTLSDYHARASSAGACARALGYHRLGIAETDPLDPDAGLTFELGTLLHIYLDAVLVEFGLPVEMHEHEIRVPYAYGEITGHIDRSIGGSTIIDLKSASRVSFDMMVETNAPLSSHRAQINFYLHGAKLAGLPYTHSLIVAYCKDPGMGQQRTPWISPPIPYNPELAAETIRMFEAVESHARANTVPLRPYNNAHDFPCRFCRWRTACWDASNVKADAVANLGDLEDVVARYKTLRSQAKAIEDERDALGGQIKAAMLDQQAAKGTAGAWDVTLSQYDRVTIDPDLVSSEVLKNAGKTTKVTTLHITKRKNGQPPR